MSGINRTECGLGRSRKDTYLMGYIDADDTENVNITYCIQDGIPAWVRIRITDMGTSKVVGIGYFVSCPRCHSSLDLVLLQRYKVLQDVYFCVRYKFNP